MATLCHSNAILCALLRPRSEWKAGGAEVSERHSLKAIPQVVQHQTQICARWSIKIANTIPHNTNSFAHKDDITYVQKSDTELGLGNLN